MLFSRRIGAEFEFQSPIPHTHIVKCISDTGLKCQFKGSPVTGVLKEFDGAIEPAPFFRGMPQPNKYNLEYKTNILNSKKWKKQVPIIFDTLIKHGCVLDRRAVYHVNIDFPELNTNWKAVQRVANQYFRYQNVIYSLVWKSAGHPMYTSRRMRKQGLTYINNLKSKTEVIRYAQIADENKGLNITPLQRDEPYIEWRHSQGTLDYTWATQWAVFINRFIDYAVDHRKIKTPEYPITDSQEEIDKLCKQIGYDYTPLIQNYQVVTEGSLNNCDPQIKRRINRGKESRLI